MINPERSYPIKERLEGLKETLKAGPKTDLQKDYKRIEDLMRALESPAPGMDLKLKEDKEELYRRLNLPKTASMETVKLAFGQAVAAEKVINTSEAAKETFKQAGVESPYRIARVAIEFNVLADEVGDLKEARFGNIDLTDDAKAKIKKFETIDKEWDKITEVMQEYVTVKQAFGEMKRGPETAAARIERKKQEGEKTPFKVTPSR